MHKRERIYLRIATGDATLLRTAATKLDMSMSELIRRAAVQAAIEAIRRGAVPPAGAES